MASPIPRLTAELDQLNARLKASELVCTFTELEAFEYETLRDQHPNRDNPLLRWDEKTFAPALVAAACVKVSGVWESDTGLTEPETVELFARLNTGQKNNLFATALGLQTADIEPFTPAATGQTDGSEQNSTTA